MVKKAHFIGIDLTSSPSKPTACVALNEELYLVWFDFLTRDADIIEAIEYHHPRLVAVDSPLSLPKGALLLGEELPVPATVACKRKVVRKGAISPRYLLLLHHKEVDHKEYGLSGD